MRNIDKEENLGLYYFRFAIYILKLSVYLYKLDDLRDFDECESILG